MRAMLRTSSGSGRPRPLAYTVSSKMFHASAHSVAGHGFTSMRKGGRRVSTPQERKKQSFEPNSSAWSFFIPERQTLWSTNQAQFDEHVFPFRNRSIVDKFQRDNSIDILFQAPTSVKWIPYNRLHVSNYITHKVHYDPPSDIMVLRVNTSHRSSTTWTCWTF
jgi:hypothetical protein